MTKLLRTIKTSWRSPKLLQSRKYRVFPSIKRSTPMISVVSYNWNNKSLKSTSCKRNSFTNILIFVPKACADWKDNSVEASITSSGSAQLRRMAFCKYALKVLPHYVKDSTGWFKQRCYSTKEWNTPLELQVTLVKAIPIHESLESNSSIAPW